MTNKLGQFYTDDLISNLMISRIINKNPTTIVELGIGQGSLAKAALRRWKNSQIIGVDIDINNIETLNTKFPEIQCFLINGLSSNLSNSLKVQLGSIDVGICNPPYLPVIKKPEIEEILISAKLGSFENYSLISSDLVFLAQNLKLIKDDGELAIILPDGMITSHNFEQFRNLLLMNYKVSACIELPSKIFKKTEAKTHILVIKKSSQRARKINLYRSNHKAELKDKISITLKMAIKRMDFNFYALKPKLIKNSKSLAELKAKVFRGSASKKILETMNYNFIHTSDFTSNNKEIILKDNENVFMHNMNFAQEGDILIPRVGKRCLGKALKITKGKVLISDCVYVIRLKKEFQENLFNVLESDYGKNWVAAHAHGVCAKVISKKDLMKFTIPSENT
jgi:type I restriction enzyme M protein